MDLNISIMDGKYYTSNAHDKRYNFNYLVVRQKTAISTLPILGKIFVKIIHDWI